MTLLHRVAENYFQWGWIVFLFVNLIAGYAMRRKQLFIYFVIFFVVTTGLAVIRHSP